MLTHIAVPLEHLDTSSAASPHCPKLDRHVEFGNLAVQCPPHTTERALIQKLDWKLLPILCIIYIMAFLDR